jgi:hypothetical protein
MLELLIIVLIVLWLVGAVVVHTGGLIHFLLVVALVLVVYRLIKGDRVL